MVSVAKVCSVEVCDRPVTAKGLCSAHYNRLNRNPEADMSLPVGKRGRPIGQTLPIPHGTTGGYTNYLCRCDDCRQAWNAYIRARSEKIRRDWDGTVDPSLKHGLESTYQSKGCRCKDCLDGHARRARQTNAIKRHPNFDSWKKSITCCQICGKEAKLVLDHDHQSGSIRGILCNGCNTALGKFGDSEQILLAAINYLARTKDGINLDQWRVV